MSILWSSFRIQPQHSSERSIAVLDESSQLQPQCWTRMQPLLSTPSLKRHCLITSQLILSNLRFGFALDQLANGGVTLWTWPSLILLQPYPPAYRRKLLLWRWLSDLMAYLSSSLSKLWNILSTKSAWRSCISLSFSTRLLLYSLWYDDPRLEHWPLALSLKTRCISLSFPSCSSPSVIFLIWRSISGTLTSCIVLEVSLSLSLSLPARLPSVIFLIWRSISGTLTSCIILEVSLHLSLSFPSCSSPSVIFLIWRSMSGTLTSCIILEVSLYLSLSLPTRLLL